MPAAEGVAGLAMVEDLDPRRGDPDVIGPYTLLGRLGSGGFGTVYAGRPAGRADPVLGPMPDCR